MTEATKRPWYASHDGNGYDHIQSAAVNEDNYVARVDSTDAQGNANADLIVKAVNNHDALVAALEICKEALMNVPVVGEPYDQQHSDFQMHTYNIVMAALNPDAVSI